MKKEDTEMMLRIFETERAGYAYLYPSDGGEQKRTISRPRQKISQIISAATCLKPKRSSSQICVTG